MYKLLDGCYPKFTEQIQEAYMNRKCTGTNQSLFHIWKNTWIWAIMCDNIRTLACFDRC